MNKFILKHKFALVGGYAGVIIVAVSGYSVLDWQFYVLFTPVLLMQVVAHK